MHSGRQGIVEFFGFHFHAGVGNVALNLKERRHDSGSRSMGLKEDRALAPGICSLPYPR
jgi:hypothetical protein